MKISLGPVQYYWKGEVLDKYYECVAVSGVDIVYLGETVCYKRREYALKDYLNVAHMLREAGKEVVLSGIVLVESPADLRMLSRYCDNGEFSIEVNDLGAASLLEDKGLTYTVGAAVSCYNHHTLLELYRRGMRRWVVPVELSRQNIEAIINSANTSRNIESLEVELMVLGYMPLAWSARCFTARSENKSKDECGLCCINYPKGRDVYSQDGSRLFTLNGLQTQSGSRLNLLTELPTMQPFINIARISPDIQDDLSWINAFRERGELPTSGVGDCNGYWFNMSGIVQV